MRHEQQKRAAWETEIAGRLREFRRRIGISQRQLGELIGLTRDQFASIELGRAPLLYSAAWRLHTHMELSLDWLAEGGAAPGDSSFAFFPPPEATGMSPRARFSDVVIEVRARKRSDIHRRQIQRQDSTPEHISWRLAMRLAFDGYAEHWFDHVPDTCLVTFIDEVVAAGNRFVLGIPKEETGTVLKRAEEMGWAALRERVLESGVLSGSLEKSEVDKITLKGNCPPVLSEIQKMLERLKLVSSVPGRKKFLAERLDVSPSRISEWLSGEKEPGGDYTLRLLHWVEKWEREQQKRPGSASNTTRAKAQSERKYEQPNTSGPPKR